MSDRPFRTARDSLGIDTDLILSFTRVDVEMAEEQELNVVDWEL